MAHLSIPPAEVIGRAVVELLADAGDNGARRRALSKAQYHLTVGELPIVPTVNGFLVPSGMRGGVIHRVSTVNGCDCEASLNGRHCWHQAALHILEIAAKYSMPRLVKRDTSAQYRAAVDAMDELFS
jgi:hypothetical protein